MTGLPDSPGMATRLAPGGGSPLLPDDDVHKARRRLRLGGAPLVVLHDRTGRIGLVIVGILFAVALVGPLISPNDPLAVSSDRLAGPGWSHLLGTDEIGRDVLSRLLVGARVSLGAALVAAVLVMTIAVVVGSVAGFLGGLVDSVIMRVVDVILAFPGFILALAITGLMKPGLLPVMIAVISVWWVGYARIIRGMVRSIRQREFIEGSRALGAGTMRLVRRHVLPHVLAPVVVLLTLDMGAIILTISALSYLGLGAQPPTPEWGAMLNEGRAYFLSDPWLTLGPGLAISVAVLGFNLLGDSIRDVVDPSLR